MTTTNANTQRFYKQMQAEFFDWCVANETQPVHEPGVARYLEDVLGTGRGPSVAAAQLSAVGCLFRSNGLSLDTKAPEIQAVMAPARAFLAGQRAARKAKIKKGVAARRKAHRRTPDAG